jgi:hypothetical protein
MSSQRLKAVEPTGDRSHKVLLTGNTFAVIPPLDFSEGIACRGLMGFAKELLSTR